MKFLNSLALSLSLLFQQALFAGEVKQQKPIENLSKGAYQNFYKEMKQSVDAYIKDYNDKRIKKEFVLKYFHKDDRQKLLKLIKEHQVKEFPAIKLQDQKYIYKINNDNQLSFTLKDLQKYQILINGKAVNLKEINRLDQMLKVTEKNIINKSSVYYLNNLIGLPTAEAGGLFGVVVVGVVLVGYAAHYVSEQFDPDFQEAKALGKNFKRVKEIAALCKANKEGLIANLNKGVNSQS